MTDRGFTLVELLVVLAITGLTVGVAHAMLTTVVDAASRADTHAVAHTAEANARDWLTRALTGSIAGGPADRPFQGAHRIGEDGLERDLLIFASRVRTGGGVEARIVRLQIRDRCLVAELAPPPGTSGGRSEQVVLFSGVRQFGADYLSVWNPDARWLDEWISTAAAPLAVRLRIDRGDTADTLVIPMGARG